MTQTLDELVAVKVMGWTRCSDDCPATGTCFFVDTDGSVWFHGGIVPFHPSTRIVDAWEVVEKMKGMWVQVSYQPMSDDGMEHEKCNASFQPVGGARALGMAQASTAPLAITLAALRACGVTEGEIEAAQDPKQ